MTRPLARLRELALGFPVARGLSAVDRFPGGGGARREQVEEVVRAFLAGYALGLEQREPTALARALDALPLAPRGFAYEGAGMALGLVDAALPPRARRLVPFARGAGAAHVYTLLVGAGWAQARLGPLGPRARRALLAAEPLLGWLALDGAGFHAGFFEPERHHVARAAPRGLSGYAARAFDQGLGRSLWFFHAADRAQIPARVAEFDAARRADLWSGVGLACAYAGGEPEATLRVLVDAAGEARPALAQGVAFAAEARERAGCRTAGLDLAARVVWSASPAALARLVREERERAQEVDPLLEAQLPRYERWRAGVRARMDVEGASRGEGGRVVAV